MKGKYYDKYDTIDPQVYIKIENKKLQTQIKYMYENSSFFKERLDRVNMKPDDITCMQDLKYLPFMTKSDLRESQVVSPPLGLHQTAPHERIVRMHVTSGTTGRPVFIGLTQRDSDVWTKCGARTAWTMGLRPNDTLITCTNLSFYAGGIADHLSSEKAGAACIPVGIGQTDRILDLYSDLKPTVLFCITSYAFYLAEAAMKRDINPRELGFKKLFLGGEPGAAIPSTRNQLEEIWGAEVYDGYYGLGDVMSSFAGECEYHNGMHFCGHEAIGVELIDPISGEVIDIKDGAEGEFVITSIDREATPVLRFRTNDMVQVFTNKCKCGRTSARFKIKGRSDDMFNVIGVNVFPSAIESIIRSYRPYITGEFFVELKTLPVKPPVPIYVEVENHLPTQVKERMEQEIREKLNFRCEIFQIEKGIIKRQQHKSKRVFHLYKGDSLPDK